MHGGGRWFGPEMAQADPVFRLPSAHIPAAPRPVTGRQAVIDSKVCPKAALLDGDRE